MRHLIFALSAVLLWMPACADPKCPADYILNQGRCKRCPEGSEAHGDVCVNEDGVIVSSAQTDGDDGGGSTATSNSEAGAPPVAASEGGTGFDASPSPTPQSGDSGASSASSAGASATVGTDATTVISGDTGAAPIIDPCQGMPGCVACTVDAQCPDPGACLLKHCSTAKSICEPTFAPAQTACGSSKCDGAGKCVGCLNDNDCGEPGECKVRYCNPSTRVCEPKNAPSTTTCPTGHCEQGACVQCSTTSECADKTCQTKNCVSGQCRYANVPTGQKGTCTSGVCTASQQCAECIGDEQCTRFNGDCTTGRCMGNVCRSEMKTGPCGPLKMCSGTSCLNSCGTNQTVDIEAGEECDPSRAPYNNWTCNSATCKLTGYSASALSTPGSSYRKICGNDAACATNEMCWPGTMCVPKCIGTSCPSVPGYTIDVINSGAPCSATTPCVVFCSQDSQCPPGVKCTMQSGGGGICSGPFY